MDDFDRKTPFKYGKCKKVKGMSENYLMKLVQALV